MRLARTSRLTLAAVVTALVATLIAPAGTAHAGPGGQEEAGRPQDQRRCRTTSRTPPPTWSPPTASCSGSRASCRPPRPSSSRPRPSWRTRGPTTPRSAASSPWPGRRRPRPTTTSPPPRPPPRETTDKLASIARQAYQTAGMGELDRRPCRRRAPTTSPSAWCPWTPPCRCRAWRSAQLDVDRAQITAKQARLVAVRQQVAALKAQAEAGLARAAVLEKQAEAAQARLQALVADQARTVHAISARKAAERKRLNALESQARKLRAQLAAIARAQLRRAHSSRRRHAVRRLPVPPGQRRLDLLGVRPAVPPDPALLAAARRDGLRRRLRHPRARGGHGQRGQRRLGRRLRQPDRRSTTASSRASASPRRTTTCPGSSCTAGTCAAAS